MPLKWSAPSNCPDVQLQPGPNPPVLSTAPSRRLPELSCAVAPAVSSNLQCPTSPVARLPGASVATPTDADVQPAAPMTNAAPAANATQAGAAMMFVAALIKFLPAASRMPATTG